MDPTITLPPLAEEDQTPLVRQLIAIIRQQAEHLQQLKEENQELRDELARLKKHARRPKLTPSQLEKRKKADRSEGEKRPGSAKRRKTETLTIHETRRIAPEHVPDGSTFKGCTTYTVQDIRITSHNICYELEHWEGPDGIYYDGQLPPSARSGHFGPTLRSFILYQYYHGHVTQPRLLEQLREYGVDISSGQLSRILTEDHEAFHGEKADLLAMALQVSPYLQVDDTGARHQGKNGYCTQIGNAWFTWFASTDSKSRLNFLLLLRAGRTAYGLEPEALTYMEHQGLPKKWVAILGEFTGHVFPDEAAWQGFLAFLGLDKPGHVQIATEGAVLGAVILYGVAPDLVILSDGAGQFVVLLHALCWIHAERSLTKLIPVTDQEHAILEATRARIWQFYEALKTYQQAPDTKQKTRLACRFDEIFTATTGYEALDTVLSRLAKHKVELLRVLDHPEIPLHNNGSEQAIREYVTRRKMSGGTRSEAGRQSRDTFTSLKQTCRKLGVSFWQYLIDRLGKHNELPPLPDLLQQQALKPG
jgi:hypothetical protein